MKNVTVFMSVLLITGSMFASPSSENPVRAADGPTSQKPEVTQVRVGTGIINNYIPNIGVNEFGDSGGTAYAAGNLIPDAGFEPISIRRLYRVQSRGTVEREGVRYHWMQTDGGGITEWDLVTTGFLNGATYRLYRLVDENDLPLPANAGYLDLSMAQRMVRIGEGRVPEAGEPGLPLGGFVDEPGEKRIYLDGAAPVEWDYIVFEKVILRADPDWSHPRLDDSGHSDQVAETWRPGWGLDEEDLQIERISHDSLESESRKTDVAREFPWQGDSVMSFSSEVAGRLQANGPYIFFPLNQNTEGDWYGTLEPGVRYRYEAWMRSESPVNSTRAVLGFFSMYEGISRQFDISNDWEKYSFTFTAPEAPRFDGWHGGPSISFDGPARLFVDNIRLYPVEDGRYSPVIAGARPDSSPAENSQEPAFDFAPSRRSMELLLNSQGAEGPKGVLRSMYVMMNNARMQSLLTPFADSSVTYDWYLAVNGASAMTLPAFLNYAALTGEDPLQRMKPWLNISSRASEEEWAMLIEYLAAPIDPDDPNDVAAKPWAYLRYQLRGTPEPWTDAFDRIFVEFANETWHNGAVESQWQGWAQAYHVHQGSVEFGLWVEYLTGWLSENSPWFTDAIVSGSIRLVMGSNYDDYAERALESVDDPAVIAAIGHTTYVGPRWEQGENVIPKLNDQGYQATLLGYIAGLDAEFARYSALRSRAASEDRNYEILGYEGGPSGYALPGQDSDEQREIAEAYGKSLAMGVAAADSWLGARSQGFREMAYHAFTQGTHWSSHTSLRRGLRPHPGWLALTLINRHTGGSMRETTVSNSPMINWAGETLPLLGAYSFENDDSFSVALVNRSLTETITTAIDIPEWSGTVITRYALEGDPRATNRFATEVEITESIVDAEAIHDLPLKPGSFVILTFEK